MSETLAAAGTIPIWMAYAATGAIVTSWPELLLRAMSESVFLLWLESVLTSMVCVTTWVVETMRVEIPGP